MLGCGTRHRTFYDRQTRGARDTDAAGWRTYLSFEQRRVAGSRTAGLMRAFKLLETASRTWRRIDAHDLLPLVLVRAGVVFMDGQSVEPTEPHSQKDTGRVAAYHPNQRRLTISLRKSFRFLVNC